MTYPPYQPAQFNPYMPSAGFQPRVDMQGYPPPQNAVAAPQSPVQGLSPASRPVTSREEAMGVGADFSGVPMVFPDVTHDRVYIKRWDLASGGPIFQEYAPVLRAQTDPQQTAAPVQTDMGWASIQEVQDLRDMVDRLQAEVDRLKRPAIKGGKANDSDK